MSDFWPESVVAEELAAQRARLELLRWRADVRQILAEADPPPVFIEPPEPDGS